MTRDEFLGGALWIGGCVALMLFAMGVMALVNLVS